MPPDPNIEQLHRLADNYRAAQEEAKRAQTQTVGASAGTANPPATATRHSARESQLAQGTIQNIVGHYPYKQK